MHDVDGKALHIGDRVESKNGDTFYINGAVLDNGTVVGQNVKKAKHAARAQDVKLIEQDKRNVEKDALGEGCIVWGNGPPDPNAPA